MCFTVSGWLDPFSSLIQYRFSSDLVAVVVFGVEEVPAFELIGWMIVVVNVPLSELMAYLEVSGKGYMSAIDKCLYEYSKYSSDKKKDYLEVSGKGH